MPTIESSRALARFVGGPLCDAQLGEIALRARRFRLGAYGADARSFQLASSALDSARGRMLGIWQLTGALDGYQETRRSADQARQEELSTRTVEGGKPSILVRKGGKSNWHNARPP